MNTSNLDIELLYSNQAQKEIIINKAVIKIDALLNSGVVSKGLNNPPESINEGDLYIIGNNPTDDWDGYANYISYYYCNKWYFIQPKEGSMIWVNDLREIYIYYDNIWNAYHSK